jgi:uncharacterized cupredoxin-like copper-binding protein
VRRERRLRPDPSHNLDIQAVKVGPFLNPGQAASVTVNLQAGHFYTYLCDVPGHAELGMTGSDRLSDPGKGAGDPNG